MDNERAVTDLLLIYKNNSGLFDNNGRNYTTLISGAQSFIELKRIVLNSGKWRDMIR